MPPKKTAKPKPKKPKKRVVRKRSTPTVRQSQNVKQTQRVNIRFAGATAVPSAAGFIHTNNIPYREHRTPGDRDDNWGGYQPMKRAPNVMQAPPPVAPSAETAFEPPPAAPASSPTEMSTPESAPAPTGSAPAFPARSTLENANTLFSPLRGLYL